MIAFYSGTFYWKLQPSLPQVQYNCCTYSKRELPSEQGLQGLLIKVSPLQGLLLCCDPEVIKASPVLCRRNCLNFRHKLKSTMSFFVYWVYIGWNSQRIHLYILIFFLIFLSNTTRGCSEALLFLVLSA